jgi:hypothetical protein
MVASRILAVRPIHAADRLALELDNEAGDLGHGGVGEEQGKGSGWEKASHPTIIHRSRLHRARSRSLLDGRQCHTEQI